MTGDGGGKAPALSSRWVGADRAARFLTGLARLGTKRRLALLPMELNSEPGLPARRMTSGEGPAMVLEIASGEIRQISLLLPRQVPFYKLCASR